MSLPRDLAETTEAELQGLINARAVENQYLEFKQELPGRDNSAKHGLSRFP